MSERPPSRVRVAWMEEWMSSLASHLLPYLAERDDIYYVVPVGDAAALVEEVARLVGKPDVIASYAARAHERAGKCSWEEARLAMDRIIRETAISAR